MPIEMLNATSVGAVSRTAIPSSGNLTAMGWFKKVVNQFIGIITVGGNGGSQWGGLWFFDDDVNLDFLANGGGDDPEFFVGPGNNEWFFAALVLDSSEANEWIGYARQEGQTVLTASARQNKTSYTPDFFAFGDSPFDEVLGGDASAFKVWDAALTEEEILRESYAIRPIRLTNLWSWAPAFSSLDTDDGTNTGDLLDYSGNARHWAPNTNLRDIDNVLGNNIPLVPYGNSARTIYPIAVASSNMAANPQLAFSTVADLSAPGALEANTAMAFNLAARLGAEGRLEAATTILIDVAAELRGAGALSAAATMAFSTVADLVARGRVRAAAALAFAVTANITNANAGPGALTANPQLTFVSTAALSALGQVRAAPTLSFAAIAELTARGELRAAANLAFAITADLTDATPPLGPIAANPQLAFSLSPALGARGSLLAGIGMSFSAIANLTDANFTPQILDKLADPTSRRRGFYSKRLNLFAETVEAFLERQEMLVREVVQEIPRPDETEEVIEAIIEDPRFAIALRGLHEQIVAASPATERVDVLDLEADLKPVIGQLVREARDEEDIIAIVALIAVDRRYLH